MNDAVIEGWARGLRGVAWDNGADGFFLSTIRYGSYDLTRGNQFFGFRVVSVPEPMPVVLTMVARGILLIRRKR